MFFEVGTGFTLCHEVDAEKNEGGGNGFFPREDVLPDEDCHDRGDDGLGVVVHADRGWANTFQGDGDEQVGDPGCHDDDIKKAQQGV